MLLAAAVTNRLQSVPTNLWIKIGLGLLALIVLVVLLRKLAGMNKVVLGVIVFVVLTIIGFNWIYERNEPAWATPVVEKLATFFPSKGAK